MGTISTRTLKKVMLWLVSFVIFAQNIQHQWGKGNFALFKAFAFLDIDLHTFAVDISELDVNTL